MDALEGVVLFVGKSPSWVKRASISVVRAVNPADVPADDTVGVPAVLTATLEGGREARSGKQRES